MTSKYRTLAGIALVGLAAKYAPIRANAQSNSFDMDLIYGVPTPDLILPKEVGTYDDKTHKITLEKTGKPGRIKRYPKPKLPTPSDADSPNYLLNTETPEDTSAVKPVEKYIEKPVKKETDIPILLENIDESPLQKAIRETETKAPAPIRKNGWTGWDFISYALPSRWKNPREQGGALCETKYANWKSNWKRPASSLAGKLVTLFLGKELIEELEGGGSGRGDGDEDDYTGRGRGGGGSGGGGGSDPTPGPGPTPGPEDEVLGGEKDQGFQGN